MRLQRLTSTDADLLRQAWKWDDRRPRWFRDMDAVFWQGSVENLIEQLNNWRKVFVGVFTSGLEAVIIVTWHGNGSFEADLMARRGANTAAIMAAAHQLMHDLLAFGMQEAFVWVAAKHISVRKLCVNIGLMPDGVVMYKGAYRGRVIKWLRHSVTREQLEHVED
jgi:hypothetical protein